MATLSKNKMWIEDPLELLQVSSFKDVYPNKTNTFEKNINAIARIIILFGLLFTVITTDPLFLTEALKYLVLLGVIAFIYITNPYCKENQTTVPELEQEEQEEQPVDAVETFQNKQGFVDKGGIDSGIGATNKWGGIVATDMAKYREKFTPEPLMSRVGSPSYDERNINLRKTAFFDKNMLNVRSTTAGFPATRIV